MRILILAVLALGTVAVQPAAAQTFDPNYPACLHNYRWGGEDYDCSYSSLAQCAASASARPAQCVTNPYFARAYAAPAPRRMRRHRPAY
jgi:hypothetical protein